jgi:hypothetical protein
MSLTEQPVVVSRNEILASEPSPGDIPGKAEFVEQLTKCYEHFFAIPRHREDEDSLVLEGYCSLLLDAVQAAVGWLPLAGISLNLLNDKVADACILYRVFLLPS